MKNKLFLGLVASTMIFATSCGSLPQENIDATQAAVEAAKTAQADVYMPTEFQALQDSLTGVMQAIETENANLCKNFDAITAKLGTLKTEAEALALAAPEKKNEVKMEAEANLANIKAAIEAANASIAKAPKKANKEVVEQVKATMESVATTVSEIEASMASEVNYAEVITKLNAVQGTISGVNTEVETTILKK